MHDNHLWLLSLLLAPPSLWAWLHRVRRHRSERAASPAATVVRVERWLFRAMIAATIGIVVTVFLYDRPNTWPFKVSVALTVAALAVFLAASFAAGVYRAGED